MFTNNRMGYVLLLTLFLLSVVCLLYLNVFSWVIYLAATFILLFVFQLFALIRASALELSLKKDLYVLVGLLIIVVVSTILWVFVFTWCKYIASVTSLAFVYVLFTKLRDGNIRNKINEE